MTFIIGIILRSTVLLVAGLFLYAILRSASAATRHLVLMLTLVAMLVLPFAALMLPQMALPLVAEADKPELTSESTRAPLETRLPGLPVVADSGPVSPPSSVRRTMHHSWTFILIATWVIGASIVLGRLVLGLLTARRHVRSATEVRDSGVHRLIEEFQPDGARVRVLLTAGITVPSVSGLVRKTILLPACATEWGRDRVRLVLAHEYGHVVRHDTTLVILTQIVCAVYWFNPFVWYAAARLRLDRELACDDRVLRDEENSHHYAAHLLEIARLMRPGVITGSTASMVQPSHLERRLKALLDVRRRRGVPSRAATAFALCCGTVALVVIATVTVVAVPGSVSRLMPLLPSPVLSELPTPTRNTQSWHGVQSHLLRAAATPIAKEVELRPAILQSVAARQKFEVASIKPNHSGITPSAFGVGPSSAGPTGCHGTDRGPQTIPLGRCMFTNVTAGFLLSVISIMDGKEYQFSGLPDWVTTEAFDIDAKAERPITTDELAGMLKELLVDRFKCSFRIETRQVAGFVLAPVATGAKFKKANDQTVLTTKEANTSVAVMDAETQRLVTPDRAKGLGRPLRLVSSKATVAKLAGVLSNYWSGPIIDATRLDGYYTFQLHWQPEANSTVAPERTDSALPTALQEQLGLKLEARRVPVEFVVVDHIERPSADDEASRSVSTTPLQLASMAPVFPSTLTQATFEVASIKPESPSAAADPVGCRGRDGTYHPAGLVRGEPPRGRCLLPGIKLLGLINAAYNLFPNSNGLGIQERIIGAPSWANVDTFHVEGVAGNPTDVTQAELQEMLRTLLAERFKLQIHRETRTVAGYALEVSDRGAKLKEVRPIEPQPSNTSLPAPIAPQVDFKQSAGERIANGHAASIGVGLVRVLSATLGTPILDKTGLTGVYDFALRWAPSPDETRIGRSSLGASPDGPSLFTALTEQLGLRLVSQKVSVEVIVIDHVEKPSLN